MEKSRRPQAFDFLTVRDFIAAYDEWAAGHLKPSYSRRALAKRAGVNSPNFMTLIINGTRKPQGVWLEGFLKATKIAAAEGDYLLMLAKMENTKDVQERHKDLNKIETFLNRHGKNSIAAATVELAKDPLAWDLLQLLDLVDCDSTVGWFKRRLRRKASVPEIRSGLQALQKLNLVKMNRSGAFVPSNTHMSTPDQIKPAENLSFHSYVLSEAKELLIEMDPSERSFGSLTLGLPQSRVEEFKSEVSVFAKSLIRRYGDSSRKSDEVFRLNIQMYPITQKKGK